MTNEESMAMDWGLLIGGASSYLIFVFWWTVRPLPRRGIDRLLCWCAWPLTLLARNAAAERCGDRHSALHLAVRSHSNHALSSRAADVTPSSTRTIPVPQGWGGEEFIYGSKDILLPFVHTMLSSWRTISIHQPRRPRPPCLNFVRVLVAASLLPMYHCLNLLSVRILTNHVPTVPACHALSCCRRRVITPKQVRYPLRTDERGGAEESIPRRRRG